MPSISYDRIPLPSLRTYVAFSILIFSISVYYALHVIRADAEWINDEFLQTMHENAHALHSTSLNKGRLDDGRTRLLWTKIIMSERLNLSLRLRAVLHVITEETVCMWVLINMIYCIMILIGKGIQKVVFGDLRVIEQQHMKDKFWNFVFYKFIFIFGVMNVQFVDEVVLWCGWFSLVGAFRILSTLCKDRFEYLSFSPTTPKWTHLRLLSLLFFILSVSVSLCTLAGQYANYDTFFLMAAEWGLVFIETAYVLVRYVLHLYNVTQEGIWEKRGVYTYYCELIADLASLTVDLVHHVHMLMWKNMFISVASLVIVMQMRALVNDIQRKLIKHKNYLRVSRHVENNFPLATKEEIEENSDGCAICWDKMETARKLPCGHFFHKSCLHSWLEQVTNCPTCRTSLVPKQNANVGGGLLGQDARQTQTTNHFFHFDGSRYVSWLPSFSVEVSHTSLLGERPPMMPSRATQLDNMVSQVLLMFPHMPYTVVFEDLLITHSVEHTVENILEERLRAPPTPVFSPSSSPHFSPDSDDTSYSTPLNTVPGPGEGASSSGSSSGSEEPPLVTGGDGCRFSKNSSERQVMLDQRKDDLVRKARLRYVSRIGS